MDSTSSVYGDTMFSYEDAVRNLEYSLQAPSTIRTIVEDEVKRITSNGLFQAIETGKKIASEQMLNDFKLSIAHYLNQLVELCKKIHGDLSSFTDVTIIDYRAKFTPLSGDIDLFIIVECADFKRELAFGEALSRVEREWLREKKTFSEILYASKDKSLDIETIKREYPFGIKV
jgi:hypothetical protein